MMRWLACAVIALAVFAGCDSPTTRVHRPNPPTVWVKCPDCGGEGWKCHGGVCEKCKRCGGSGRIPDLKPRPDDEDVQGKRKRRRR